MNDVVKIGNATLYHADCRDVLPSLPVHDLLLTDPPYGIGEAAGNNKSRSQLAKATDYGDDNWDNETIPEWVLSLILAKAKHQIIFGGNYYRLPPTTCWLVWDKDNTGDFADAELAWTNLRKAVRLKKWRWNGMLQENMAKKEARYHPTQKPVAVIEWALSHAPERVMTVCDPFMGSGTTGVACAHLGKAFTGIERERKYFDIALERIAGAQAQWQLFNSEPDADAEQSGLDLTQVSEQARIVI